MVTKTISHKIIKINPLYRRHYHIIPCSLYSFRLQEGFFEFIKTDSIEGEVFRSLAEVRDAALVARHAIIYSLKSRIYLLTSIYSNFTPQRHSQLRFLHHSNQRLQLLRGKAFKFFHDVCIIIQLQEPRVKLHLLRERKGIDIAVGDITVYRVTHTLGYIVMRYTGMSEVCCKGVSAPCTAWLDFPAHTLDKTTDGCPICNDTLIADAYKCLTITITYIIVWSFLSWEYSKYYYLLSINRLWHKMNFWNRIHLRLDCLTDNFTISYTFGKSDHYLHNQKNSRNLLILTITSKS